jgi:hypothetical protein
MSFAFGVHALGWLRLYKLDDAQIRDIERGVQVDLDAARATRPRRPPSRAAMMRAEARRLMREAGREARR